MNIAYSSLFWNLQFITQELFVSLEFAVTEYASHSFSRIVLLFRSIDELS